MKKRSDNKNQKATNKGDLVSSIAELSGLSKADSTLALEGFMESIKKGLKDGKDIKILGLGTFSVAKREPRTGRNPRTGLSIKIAASKLPRFRSSKILKEAIS